MRISKRGRGGNPGLFALWMALAAGIRTVPAAAQADTLWMRLDNGKDLSGWSHDAKYFRVDSGMIVAKGAADRNTFCIRKGTFSDFELRFRARLFENLGYANSGVQYRSVADTVRYESKGYQLEMGAGGCGGFYNEGGLPASLGYKEPSAACRAAIRRNDWNDYAIVADGRHITHWLNGVKCYEMSDISLATGVIALQLHQAQGKGVMEADFKELHIRPLNGAFTIPDSLAVHLGGTSGVSLPPHSGRGPGAGMIRVQGWPEYRIDGRSLPVPTTGTAPGAAP